MTVRKTVESVEGLARGAVSTAVSAARHPIGTAAMAAGLVKGTAQAGIGLLRRHPVPAQAGPTHVTVDDAVPDEREVDEAGVADLDVPDAEDLADVIVIEAEPEPEAPGEPLPETGEAFHTEPKAASRASAHGGPAGDREEIEGYLEEIPEPEEEPVWTSETPIADDGEPVLDEGVAHAVQSEAEMMQKAADPHKE